MKNLLWLDDNRNPFLNLEGRLPKKPQYCVNWVLNYKEFTQWIDLHGLPDSVSFDHDLAPEHYTPEYFWNSYEESKKYQDWIKPTYKEKTGADCAKWLINYCKEFNVKLPKIYIHSANPVGADYIRKELNIL